MNKGSEPITERPRLTARLSGFLAELRHGKGAKATLIRGSAVSLILAIISLGLGFLTNVMVSRVLGLTGYGQFSIVLAWVLILAIPATAGMDFTVLRFVPSYLDDGLGKLALRMLRFAVGVSLLAGAVSAAIILLVAYFRSDWIASIPIQDALVMSVLVILTAEMIVLSSVFRALRDMFFYQFYSQLLRACLVVIALGFFLHAGSGLTVSDMFVLFTAAASVCLFLQYVHLKRRYFDVVFLGHDGTAMYRAWFGMAFPTLVSTVMHELLVQSNLVILGIASTSEQAGLYGAAQRLAIFVTLAMTAAAGVTSPLIVKAHKDNNRLQLRRIFWANIAIALAGAGVVTLSFYFGGSFFLRAFGTEFDDAYGPLVVLSVAGIFAAISGLCANVLLMTGHQLFLARVMVVAVIVQITVSILVSSRYGAMGAAIAVLVSSVTNFAWLTLGVRRVLRLGVAKTY